MELLQWYDVKSQFFPCILDGEWSKWSDWSDCEGDCGTGTQNRKRECIRPERKDGNYRGCRGGDSKESRECDLKHPCNSKYDSYYGKPGNDYGYKPGKLAGLQSMRRGL